MGPEDDLLDQADAFGWAETMAEESDREENDEQNQDLLEHNVFGTDGDIF